MSGHTPGLWVASTGFIKTLIYWDHCEDKDELAANIRLISAAPEMLDALLLAFRLTGNPSSISSESREKIEAVIAKARGQS